MLADRDDAALLRRIAKGTRFDSVVDFLAYRPDQVEAPGRKARAVRACLEGAVSPIHPASALQDHPRTTVYLDPPTAALLERVAETH